MKYGMFIDQFKIAQNKDEFIKKHILNIYVPYFKKIEICNDIVSKTMLNLNTNELKYDTPKLYYLFILTLCHEYTDIEFDIDLDGETVFDTLSQKNILKQLIGSISIDEYQTFDTLLKMCVQDVCDNNNI